MTGPGNVRELENAMERAFILEMSNELSAQHLPESVCYSIPDALR